MSGFTVPLDFDEKKHRGIIPIFIQPEDKKGNPIPFGWIEHGVIPVADALRGIAQRVLHDKWRVSEITNHAVESLSRRNGEDLGDEPDLRVLKCAHWCAEDVRVGGRRNRRKLDVELFAATVESLREQVNPVRALEAKDTVDKLVDQLERMGLDEVKRMGPMMLRECDADEYEAKFGKSRNAISQQFYRGVRKAAALAGIKFRPDPDKCL